MLGLALLAGPAPQAAAQAIKSSRMLGDLTMACGAALCPPPSDPLSRDGFVLRLQAVVRPYAAGAGGFGFGQEIGARELAERERRASERAERSPAARLSSGAGEAFAGRFEAALPLLEQAIELARAAGDRQVEAAGAADVGVVLAMLGRYDEARDRLQSAATAFGDLRARPSLPRGLAEQAELPMLPGVRLPPEALARIRQQAATAWLPYEAAAALRGEIVAQLNLGSLEAYLGRFGNPGAQAHFEQARALAQGAPGAGWLRTVYGEMALLARRTGRGGEEAQARRLAQSAPRPEENEEALVRMTTSELAFGAALAASPAAEATRAALPATRPVAPRPSPEEARASDEETPPAKPPSALQRALDRLIAGAARRKMAESMPDVAACGGRGCDAPAEPAHRDGYVLRLAGVFRVPMAGAPDIAPGSPPFLNAAAVRQALAGRLDAARTQWARAAEQAGTADPQAAAAAAANLGVAAALGGQPDEARQRMQAALAAYDRIAAASPPQAPLPLDPSAMGASMEAGYARSGGLLVALNLAQLEAQLGRATQADHWLRDALERAVRHGHGTRIVHGDQAVVERLRGRPEAVERELRRAEAGSEGDDLWSRIQVGYLRLGPAAATPTPSPLPSPPPPSTAAGEASPSSMPGTPAEVQHARAAADGAALERAGDLPGALRAYSRAAVLAAAGSQTERERAALAALQRLHAAAGHPEAAVLYGKRSVNAVQGLRRSLGGMERAERQTFLSERKPTYVLLAQTLLDRERLPEAEQVLRLLKEDEGQQAQDAPRERGRMPYSLAETDALQAYTRLAERIRPLELRRAALAEGIAADALDSRPAIERARLRGAQRAGETLDALESQRATVAGRLDDCRRLAARAAAARSAAENERLADCSTELYAYVQVVDQASAAAAALQRDSAEFLLPPSTGERQGVDDVAARLAALQRRTAPMQAALRDLPPPPQASIQRVMTVVGGVLDVGGLHTLWTVQREIDTLADQAAPLDAGLDARLASRDAPAFTPAERTLLETGRRLLRTLPAGTAALYYLQGDERLDVLVVTPGGWQRHRAALPRAALDERIAAFRQVLGAPRADALAPARALYDTLLAPLEAPLQAARTTTLMLALEGSLRYVPFAALHDGRGWVAERYATSLYTTAAPTALAAAPARRWQAAAFGSTAGGDGLPPLPAVRGELLAIVRDRAQPSDGVMPGEIRLDDAFTRQALRAALQRRPNVVHIASHFRWVERDAGESYLLLGDGGRLRLKDLDEPGLRFDQVDLVTLSACETALVAGNSFGQEVEALGTALQARGAAAVLSTLWSVNDASTARFMRALYAAREGEGGGAGLSRAEALRRAQLGFIRGEPAAGDPDGASRGVVRAGVGAPGSTPYAHPFYWAPFVLMGNWL